MHTTFRFYLINFQLNIDFPSQFCIFYRKLNHLALLKDRFLKKMFLKRAKTRPPFFCKTIGSNNSFTLIENNFRFLRAKFEFKVTVHYSIWEKMYPVVTP